MSVLFAAYNKNDQYVSFSFKFIPKSCVICLRSLN